MKRFSHEWIAEKAKEIANEKSFVILSAPSARKANWLAWAILEELQKDFPEKDRKNYGITSARIGRYHTRNYIDNCPFFSYEYDFETKKAAYVITTKNNDLTTKPKSIAEIKLQEKMDKLITPADQKLLEKQGDTSEKSMEETTVITKLFNPSGAGTWYIYEHVENDIYMCFANLGDIMNAELGTVSLKELAEYKGMFGLGIERDKFFKPTNLKEIYDKVKAGEHV